ncbi:hypothetical protein PVA45_08545 (plasmid) [Entomospira entomophila]|uniref:Uncharacterized protein n=1 Tax=Entomospira entomophila TaxID=2719988 RepID=A0A968GBC8_9SPIO|nr:hypothetical protein [Entomospira entomophilus]NIZ41556.1 hypothetical protein [Entomospira entomophilus]WDI36460.1 hypothetical protein PVA45_08545 [Entomospira entomophilus]
MTYKNKKSLDQWALTSSETQNQPTQELKRLSILIPKENYQTIMTQRIHQLLQEGVFSIDETQAMKAPNISSYIRYLIEEDLKKQSQ